MNLPNNENRPIKPPPTDTNVVATRGSWVDLVRLARPGHWIKNTFVFFPLLFSMSYGRWGAWRMAWLAALAMCLAASAVYVNNDIRDRYRDRLHPRKKYRPVAAGRVRIATAAVESLLLAVGSLAVAMWVGPTLLAVVLAYILLQLAYSLYLRDRMIIDVSCIAVGFVLRAMAGAVAIHVEISPWLFVCTFTICLFMGFCKRYNELAVLGNHPDAGEHRSTLLGYTPWLLTHLVTLSAGIAVVSFLMYALNDRTVAHYGTDYMVYTLPVFIYGISRFAMLSMAAVTLDPTDIISKDRPFQATVVLWLLLVAGVIVWGRDLRDVLAGL